MEKMDRLWPGGWQFLFDDTLFQPGTDSFLLGAFAGVKRGGAGVRFGRGNRSSGPSVAGA